MTDGSGATEDRYDTTQRVTLIGAISNVVLAIVQATFGVIGQSQSLIADAIHSLSDLVTDIVAMFGTHHARRAADADHPYGHQRMETATTVILAMVLVIAAAVIMFDAIGRLFDPSRLLQPQPVVLIVAVISVLVKESMYRYTLRAAKRVRSQILEANAWHHRSDALSSVVVIVGVTGTLAGLNYLDAVAAIGVAVMIARVGLTQSWRAMQELVDRGVSPQQLDIIRAKIMAVPGVQQLHLLRTRKMGGNALVDVHILVHPRLSVSEAHQISEAVRAKLIDEVDEVTDVTIHIDPEDDQVARPSAGLPQRAEVIERLKAAWRDIPEAAHIEDITLHYLDGRIHAEVRIPLAAVDTLERAAQVRTAIANLAKKDDHVAAITVSFV